MKNEVDTIATVMLQFDYIHHEGLQDAQGNEDHVHQDRRSVL
jgi:hypothetical protein